MPRVVVTKVRGGGARGCGDEGEGVPGVVVMRVRGCQGLW